MYLAIDLWNKKCGVAVEIEGIAVPKDIVPRTKIISVVKTYIKKYKIHTIVVWLPYDLYGRNLRQLHKTQEFIEKLKNIFSEITVEWVDERFTSMEADFALWGTKWNKDDIAAWLILESYLALNKRKN